MINNVIAEIVDFDYKSNIVGIIIYGVFETYFKNGVKTLNKDKKVISYPVIVVHSIAIENTNFTKHKNDLDEIREIIQNIANYLKGKFKENLIHKYN